MNGWTNWRTKLPPCSIRVSCTSGISTWTTSYALLLSDMGNADALTVLQGIFRTDDVADALDDAGFRDDVYRDIEIWVDRRSDTAVALAAEDTIIFGEGERVEDSIDAFIGATRSIEQEDDVSEIVDSLGDALAYSVEENCDYRGCRRWAKGVGVESGELVAVFIFAFRDEETATDAERDIDDDLEERGLEPSIDLDGSLVTVTLPVEEEEFRLNRSAVLEFTSGEEEEPVVEQRPAPAAPRAADDHADDFAGATRISVGDRLNGDIEHEGDVDLFSFRARSGHYYTIRVRHGTNPDTILTLLDSDGRFITEDDDSGGDGEPRLEWAAPSSAIYYVEVRGFARGDIGTYRIEMGESDPEPTPAPQPTLAPAPTTVPARAADDHADGISGATRISGGRQAERRHRTRGRCRPLFIQGAKWVQLHHQGPARHQPRHDTNPLGLRRPIHHRRRRFGRGRRTLAGVGRPVLRDLLRGSQRV